MVVALSAARSLARIVLVLAAVLFAPRLASAQAPGPMSAGHADMSGPLDCVKCHDAGQGVPDAKCLGCHEHQALRDRIKAGKGFHADPEVSKKACRECHGEHKEEPPGSGKGKKTIVDWRPFGGKRNFEHQRTGWPLQGAHRFEECEACHTKKYKQTKLTTYLGLRSECITCHGVGMKRGPKSFENPHEFADPKLIDCTICHTFDNRKVANVGVTKFDHDKTDYPLDGNHLRNACVKCHKDLKTFQVEDRNFKDCAGCHKDPHRSVVSAGKKCTQCHTTNVKFPLAKFDHAKETKFPLRGKHDKNKCADCHKVDSGNEKPKQACDSCHKDAHRGRFGKETCDGCHVDGGPGWKQIQFAHDKKTKLPLTGRHQEIACVDCHRNREPKGFERFETSTCADCHRHQEAHCGQFGLENCERCHIRGGDKTSKFDHAVTRFPLEKAHAVLDCSKCHKLAKLGESPRCKEAVKYTGLEPSCVACHDDVHRGELGAECTKCHTAGENFRTLVFDHNRDSRFALTGFHQLVECGQCHPNDEGPAKVVDRKYKLGDIQCVACHGDEDVHAGVLGKDCAKCHETTGGAPKFDHDLHTRFVRLGVHRRIECERCHFLLEDPAASKTNKGVRFVKTSTESITKLAGTKAAIAPPGAPLDLAFRVPGAECSACHPDPHGVRASQPLDCGACHGFEKWKGAVRNAYHEGAGFSLTGAHDVVQCSLCHLGSGSLLGRGELCGTCHLRDDVHAGSLGPDCGKCHEQNVWVPTTFTHLDTGFPLEGVHRMLECRECHQAGNYFVGKKCYNCHLADWRNSYWHNEVSNELKNPGNIRITGGAGLVTLDCGRCHNQFTFNSGTFAVPQPEGGR
ncbi:hypothetical protein L6R52_03450 [Myxococcota bacterium]|nr:hypothetical protein [Myxococcota bacterium]